MQLTKAEMKTALQAMLDLNYGDDVFTVGDGVEFVSRVAQLNWTRLKADHVEQELVSQSMFYGMLNINNTHASTPAAATIVHSMKQTQIPTLPDCEVVIADKQTIGVGRGLGTGEMLFAYLEAQNCDGTFHGYKFEVTTTLALEEDGTPSLGEDGQPYDAEI